MSDSSFEALLIDWLGIDSMQNTDDPAQFATLLDIIANVTMGELRPTNCFCTFTKMMTMQTHFCFAE